MFFNQLHIPSQGRFLEPTVFCKSHGTEPIFGNRVVSFYMYVRRLILIGTEEHKGIWPMSEHGWHGIGPNLPQIDFHAFVGVAFSLVSFAHAICFSSAFVGSASSNSGGSWT